MSMPCIRLPGHRRPGRDEVYFSVSPPASRLHGHSSSVCRPSSTRSVSSGLRPTLRLFTVHVPYRVVGIHDERRAQRHARALRATPS